MDIRKAIEQATESWKRTHCHYCGETADLLINEDDKLECKWCRLEQSFERFHQVDDPRHGQAAELNRRRK